MGTNPARRARKPLGLAVSTARERLAFEDLSDFRFAAGRR